MKGFTTLFLIFALTTASSIAFHCPTDGVFTHYDPNLFYLCTQSNTKGIISNCGYGKGFLHNGDVTGCIPFESWECTHKMGINPPQCHTNYSLHPHLNPNMYWKCTGIYGERAHLMVCPDNQGYAQGYGCVNWANWHCKDRTG